MLNNFISDAIGKLILRLTVGVLMMFHGVAKVMHQGSLDFIGNNLTGIGLPAEIAYGVYIGEVLAPLMIILGYHARLGGLLIVINMIFAVVLAHSGDIYSLGKHGGYALELQAFYLFGGLVIVLTGSGKYALKTD